MAHLEKRLTKMGLRRSVVFQFVGKVIPTGTVTFNISGTGRAVVQLDDTGHASFSINFVLPYQHWVEAIYSGDTHYAASHAGVAERVHAASTASLHPKD